MLFAMTSTAFEGGTAPEAASRREQARGLRRLRE
jgi:hypothetical protein